MPSVPALAHVQQGGGQGRAGQERAGEGRGERGQDSAGRSKGKGGGGGRGRGWAGKGQGVHDKVFSLAAIYAVIGAVICA